MVIRQYEVYWINLDPTIGSEIKKTRPCVVISPNDMNDNINTILIAPLTSTSKNYPTRIRIDLHKKKGWIVLDQIRSIDKKRLIKKIGSISKDDVLKIKKIIQEMLVD